MTRPERFNQNHQIRNESFICKHCHKEVPGNAPGTRYRNHCPGCLWSLHVDLRSGDRLSGCQGQMEPIAIWIQYNGEWSIVHRCKKCGIIRTNRIAGDDNSLLLLSLAIRPLARPPFPLEHMEIVENHGKNEYAKGGEE